MSSFQEDYLVGDWRISPKLNRISKGSETVSVKHKSMAVLDRLADANGDVLSRNEIMDAVWPGMAVTDDVLTQSIVELRKAFADDAKHPKVIETIPRVGFRLIATVSPIAEEPIPVPDAAPNTGASPRDPGSTTIGPVRSRSYWLAGAALLIFGIVLWTLLYRPGIDRSPVVTVADPPSIAVLPFVNMSGDPDNEYFSDGVSEEILSLLARIPGLKVIGRTSSFQFKGMNEDVRVIGQELGVTTLLEGSVRRSGDRVRITAQLVDVYDGSFIWSQTYDRTMTDVTHIFEVQDNVAASIIDALQIHVSSNLTRGRPTESTEAYSLFLRAGAAANAFEWRDAEKLLLRAVELDPNFAEAYEMLAFVYWIIPGGNSVIESQRLMGETAAKAVALDPDLVLAQTYYAVATPGPQMRLRTIEAFERAARERPDDPSILEGFIFLLTEFGYLQEALTVAERYIELDPLSELANYHLPLTLYAAGHTGEAVAALEFANQSDWDPQLYRWTILGVNLLENPETAIAHVEAYLRRQEYPDSSWFRELVTGGRDPATGQAYLDRRIPEIVAAMADVDEFDWQRGLASLYLYFGHLDRYFELALVTNPSDTTWDDAGTHLWRGAVFRQLGSTANAKYLELAELMGVFDIWEQRGPPDFCEKLEGQWVCE